jgi:hypothetical protein
MERGDPLPWLAVAIEEEAVGLEHSTRTSCMGSGQMWRRHQLLGSIHRWWFSALFCYLFDKINTRINSLVAAGQSSRLHGFLKCGHEIRFGLTWTIKKGEQSMVVFFLLSSSL